MKSEEHSGQVRDKDTKKLKSHIQIYKNMAVHLNGQASKGMT